METAENNPIPRRDRRWLVALAVICLATWLPRASGPIDLRWDAGVYYTLGTSLAEGKGYRLLNEPGEIQAIQYPPLLPAVVAVHQKIVRSDDPVVVGRWLRITFFVISLSMTLATFWMLRPYLSPAWAFVATLMVSLHVMTLYLSDALFTEIPFALMGILFVGLYGRREQNRVFGALAGAAAVAAYLLRTAGVVLFITWIADALLRRQFKAAALRSVVALVPILAWNLYIAQVRHSPDYENPAYTYQRAPYQYYNVSYAENMDLADPFDPSKGSATTGMLVRRVIDNVLEMPATLGETLSAPRWVWWWMVERVSWRLPSARLHALYLLPAIALGTMILVGALGFVRRREWVALMYLGGTVALICLTPWGERQFLRYTVPIAPLAAVALIRFVLAARDDLRIRRWPRIGGAVVAVVLFVVAVGQGYGVYKVYRDIRDTAFYQDETGRWARQDLFFFDRAWRVFDHSLKEIAEQAQPGDVIVTSAPHWAYLKTGLKAVQPPFESDRDMALQLLDSIPATYVIVDEFDYPGGDVSRRFMNPMIRAHPFEWRLVYRAPYDPHRRYAPLRVFQRNPDRSIDLSRCFDPGRGFEVPHWVRSSPPRRQSSSALDTR